MNKINFNKQNIIKIAIGIVFAVFFVILFAQYITMAQLSAKQSKLDAELEDTTSQYEKLNAECTEIEENYDDYVEGYVRDNYDFVEEGDVLINK